jgi:hypothetical protein
VGITHRNNPIVTVRMKGMIPTGEPLDVYLEPDHGLVRRGDRVVSESYGGGGGGGAPTGAAYVVIALDSTLTAERVLAIESSVLSLTDGGANGNITIGIAANGVTDAKLRQSVALSVIGRAANSTGNVADIAAVNDHEVLRRSGTSLAFGAVNLASSVAVTGALPIANGGTGQTAQTAAFNALSPGTTKGDVIVHNGTNNVRVGVGSDGQSLVADSAQTTGVKWAKPSELDSFLGDGVDGSVTIAVDTTLNRSMYYSSLTVQSGATLFTNGYRVHCTGTVTIDAGGKIAGDGGDGGAASGATGGTAGTASGGDMGGSAGTSAGATGTTGAGTTPAAVAVSYMGGTGGSSGAGGAGVNAGGAGGAQSTDLKRYQHSPALCYVAVNALTATHEVQMCGGGMPGRGGASGGGDGSAGNGGGGGGGGAGGRVVWIACRALVNNGEITSLGGGGGGGGNGD